MTLKENIVRVCYTLILMVCLDSHQESAREVTVRTVHCQTITEKLKGQGQIGVESNVPTITVTSCDVLVGNAPRYEKDKNVPSTSIGQTFENDPTSIVTSDNCDEISQWLSKRSNAR